MTGTGLPSIVTESELFLRLAKDEELRGELVSLRCVVVSLAETTSRTMPEFTDHTVRHMDALWRVADRVLTLEEMAALTPAEAFLLAAGFYLHDIGMAYAATEEGRTRIKESTSYKSCLAAISTQSGGGQKTEAWALATALRSLHAEAAAELSRNEIPGTGGRYLFEKLSFREKWGTTCGEIASSHHWSISKLESHFGPQGEAPLPGGRRGDLLYVAACLRLIDFAHVNRDRAPQFERSLRTGMDEQSVIHWLAQENVDGPERCENELVYRAANPISNVDAWWLYYEMLTGLDTEIRSVKRLLDSRTKGLKRISLVGVRASPRRRRPPLSSPQTASCQSRSTSARDRSTASSNC